MTLAPSETEHEDAEIASICLKPRSTQFVKSDDTLLVGYLDDGI